MWILHLLIKNNKQQKGKKQDIQKKKKQLLGPEKFGPWEKTPNPSILHGICFYCIIKNALCSFHN